MKMKLILCALAGLLLFDISALAAPDPNFHIYLCFGQSNLESGGKMDEMDRTVDKRFQVLADFDSTNRGWKKGRWYDAVPPLAAKGRGICMVDYFGWNAANFGWGADQIENILWRVENGELDGVKPKVIVLLAGINNVGTVPGGDAQVENITRGLQALVSTCRQKAPNAVIILTALFPRNDNMAVIPIINRINGNLAKMADGKTIRYLDVNDKLADQDGKLFEGIAKIPNIAMTNFPFTDSSQSGTTNNKSLAHP